MNRALLLGMRNRCQGGRFFLSIRMLLCDERHTVVPRNNDGRQCRIKNEIPPSQESKPVFYYANIRVSR